MSKSKGIKGLILAAIAVLVVIIAAVVAKSFTGGGNKYETAFYPGTTLNGIDIAGMRPKTEFYCGHGDLFFGNMLYDPSKKLLKLVDPKGGNASSAVMPIWYDLAKLSHSFMGNYDLMVYGLITPFLNDSLELSLKIREEFRKSCHLLSNEFREFLTRRNLDFRRVLNAPTT